MQWRNVTYCKLDSSCIAVMQHIPWLGTYDISYILVVARCNTLQNQTTVVTTLCFVDLASWYDPCK